MAFFCLGSRRKDWGRECTVLTQAIWHRFATKDTFACFVFSPRMAGQIAANDKLNGKGFTEARKGNVCIRDADHMVLDQVGRVLKEVSRQPVQYLPLERDGLP